MGKVQHKIEILCWLIDCWIFKRPKTTYTDMPHGAKNIECGFEIKTILSIRYISQLIFF